MKLSASPGQHAASGTSHAQESEPVTAAQTIIGILSEALKALQQMPVIDETRIAELRQAIANDSILLDDDTLAWDMLAFYRNRAANSG